MNVDNINVDDFLPPKKGKKRNANQDVEMQDDQTIGIEGTEYKIEAPKAKRIKSDYRKIAVPPHR